MHACMGEYAHVASIGVCVLVHLCMCPLSSSTVSVCWMLRRRKDYRHIILVVSIQTHTSISTTTNTHHSRMKHLNWKNPYNDTISSYIEYMQLFISNTDTIQFVHTQKNNCTNNTYCSDFTGLSVNPLEYIQHLSTH